MFLDDVEATDVKARIRVPCQRPVTAKATSPQVSCYGRSSPPGVPDGTSIDPPPHRTEATDIRSRIRCPHPTNCEGCPFHKGITEHPLCSTPSLTAPDKATTRLAKEIPRPLATDTRARTPTTGPRASSSFVTRDEAAPPSNGAIGVHRTRRLGSAPRAIGNEIPPVYKHEHFQCSPASPTIEATDIRTRIRQPLPATCMDMCRRLPLSRWHQCS